MNDYYYPKRFLIIASIRSGGTLLSHALDSHPMIHAHRGEPVHSHDPLRKIASTAIDALDASLSFYGYEANIAKITWSQFFELKEDLPALNLDGVILLYRDNPLRVYVSEQIRLTDLQSGMNTHSFTKRDKANASIDPAYTEIWINSYLMKLTGLGEYLTNRFNNTFSVSYENLTSEFREIPRSLGLELCDFVGVGYRRLEYQTAKRNPYDFQDLIVNYEDVHNHFEKHCPNYLQYLHEE